MYKIFYQYVYFGCFCLTDAIMLDMIILLRFILIVPVSIVFILPPVSLHCMSITQFVRPLSYSWTFGLLLDLCYFEQHAMSIYVRVSHSSAG